MLLEKWNTLFIELLGCWNCTGFIEFYHLSSLHCQSYFSFFLRSGLDPFRLGIFLGLLLESLIRKCFNNFFKRVQLNKTRKACQSRQSMAFKNITLYWLFLDGFSTAFFKTKHKKNVYLNLKAIFLHWEWHEIAAPKLTKNCCCFPMLCYLEGIGEHMHEERPLWGFRPLHGLQ